MFAAGYAVQHERACGDAVYVPPYVVPDERKCKRCGIDMDNAITAESDTMPGHCTDCAREEMRYRDYQPFDLQYRYAPALVEDAW